MEKKSFSQLLGNIQDSTSERTKEGLSFEEMSPRDKKKLRLQLLALLSLALGIFLFWYSPWREELLNWATRKYLLHQICTNIYGVYDVQFQVERLSPKEREKFLEMITSTLLSHRDKDARLRLIELLELCYADSYAQLVPVLEKALSQESDYANQEKMETFLKKIRTDQYLQSLSWLKSLLEQSTSSFKKNYTQWKSFLNPQKTMDPERK